MYGLKMLCGRWRHILLVSLVMVGMFSILEGGRSSIAASNQETPSELKQMYDEDQSERLAAGNNPLKGDWSLISKHDEGHRVKVLKLMRENKIQTGDDYYYAAMIMQHGATMDDYVLAHLFSCAAAQRGKREARWLSAASFDRLMISMDKPQYFSTQYFANQGESYAIKNPKNTSLLTDEVRKAFDVPTLAETDARLRKLNDASLTK